MEFRIEGILETVLVGTLASLFLLSVLFLILGHVFKIDPIRRIAKLVLYETEVEQREEHPGTSDPRPLPSEAEEKHLTFAFLLMIAALFGLGATVEALTHDISLYNDKNIKTEAFEKVARGRVQGRAASAGFTRFVIDDIACKAAGISAQRGIDSPCLDIYRQEREFYYTAKNAVYKVESFEHELSPLQARIDFLRSACVSLALLAAATLLAFLIAAAVEVRYRFASSVPIRSPSGKKTLMEHWKDLAAVRSLLICSSMSFFAVVAYVAWEKCEVQFNRRVFGYYLSVTDRAQSDEAARHDGFASSEGPRREEEELPRNQLPSSPYRVFSLDQDAPETVGTSPRRHQHNPILGWMGQFEPSAIQTLDRFDHVIVANDKGGTSPFVLFDLDHALGLNNPHMLLPDGRHEWTFEDGPPKIEAIHAYASANGPRVLAIAASADKGKRWMADFLVDFASAKATDIRPKTLSDPCPVVSEDSDCLIEGLTVIPAEKSADQKLLLGIRFTTSRDQRRESRRPVIAIVELSHDGDDSWNHPVLLYKAKEAFPDRCRGLSGVSDLQLLDRQLLILTSIELRQPDRACDGKSTPDPVAQVRGELWRLDLRTPGTEPQLAISFAHKPEGLALLNDGSALVVFDDDGDRKSMRRGLETFPLEQYESVFTIVPVPN